MRIVAVPTVKNLIAHTIRVEFRDEDTELVLAVRDFVISRSAAQQPDWLRVACRQVISYLEVALPFFDAVPLGRPYAPALPLSPAEADENARQMRLHKNLNRWHNLQPAIELGLADAESAEVGSLRQAIAADFDLAKATEIAAPQIAEPDLHVVDEAA